MSTETVPPPLPTPLYDPTAEPGLFIIGCAAPNFEEAAKPGYDGSMHTPLEAMYQASQMSEGPRFANVSLVMEHADLLPGDDGAAFAKDKKIGGIAESWFEPKRGTMVAGFIPASRPEADLIERSGRKFGFSFFTNYKEVAATKAVVETHLPHLGVTENPAWRDHGTWIYHMTRDPVEARQLLRDEYAKQPGAYLPLAMLARLRQTESADSFEIDRRRRDRAAMEEKSRSFARSSTMASADPRIPVDTLLPAATPPAQPPAQPLAQPPVAAPVPHVDLATRVAEYKMSAARAEQIKNPSDRIFELADLEAHMEADLKKGDLDVTQLLDSDFGETKKDLRRKRAAIKDVLSSYVDSIDMSESDRAKIKALWEMTPSAFGAEGHALRTLCTSVGANQVASVMNQKQLEFERIERKKAEDERKKMDEEKQTLKRQSEDAATRLAEMQKKYDELMAEKSRVKPTEQIASELREGQMASALAAKQQVDASKAAAATTTSSSTSASAGDLHARYLKEFMSFSQKFNNDGAKGEPMANYDGKLPAYNKAGAKTDSVRHEYMYS